MALGAVRNMKAFALSVALFLATVATACINPTDLSEQYRNASKLPLNELEAVTLRDLGLIVVESDENNSCSTANDTAW